MNMGGGSMKACKFCGTEVENTKKKCPQCGATELLHVCDSCGEHYEGNFCPKCGVRLGQKGKICPECQTQYFSNACPNCGYTPSRKATVEQTVIHKHVYVNSPTQTVTKSPVAQKPVKKKKKRRWIIWAVGILVLIAIFGGNSKKDKSDSNTLKSTESVDTSAPEKKANTSKTGSNNDAFESAKGTETTEKKALATETQKELELVEVQEKIYSEDPVVNRFIIEYNALYPDDQIKTAEKGNIRTKYYVKVGGLNTELLNANENAAECFYVEITGGNTDADLEPLLQAFAKVAKVLEPDLDDSTIKSGISFLTDKNGINTTMIGKSLEVTYVRSVELSWGRNNYGIKINAKSYK